MWILNKVYVIGMGPGAYEQMTVAAVEALKGCDVIVGYTVYVDLMKKYFPENKKIPRYSAGRSYKCKKSRN